MIFTLTPYIADSYQNRASYFSQHGYVFVLVDVRGRGNSEGVFEPFAQEPHDGYDIVEFLAHQPWCNGKVAMWGGSYAGYAVGDPEGAAAASGDRRSRGFRPRRRRLPVLQENLAQLRHAVA